MNEATAKRLKDNPFYKMSSDQAKEANEVDRKPMVEFGVVPTHSQSIPMHKTKTERLARTH